MVDGEGGRRVERHVYHVRRVATRGGSMAVRVLLVLAALSMLAACGEAAQEQDKPQPETTQSQERTSDALKYGDPVELVGILGASHNGSTTRAGRS